MKAVATKVDNSIHDQVINRCNGLGCTPSEYVRNLIKNDLDQGEKAKQAAKEDSGHVTYYIHKSNPDIKLVGTSFQNGQTYYLDTEGRKWMMAPDRTLIGVARVRS